MGKEIRNSQGLFRTETTAGSTRSLNDSLNNGNPPPSYDVLRNNNFTPAYATYQYRTGE